MWGKAEPLSMGAVRRLDGEEGRRRAEHGERRHRTFRFHAGDLHLVMGPSAPGTSVRFRVLIDEQPQGRANALDVDEQGQGRVTEQPLYQLIRQPGRITDRQFQIEFLSPGVEGFVFTFG
jgi:thioredoxin family protein